MCRCNPAKRTPCCGPPCCGVVGGCAFCRRPPVAIVAPLTERVTDLRAWATSRIRACREQEEKFGNAWQHREKHTLGPPQALVEAWSERRALQAVLDMLGTDRLSVTGEEK